MDNWTDLLGSSSSLSSPFSVAITVVDSSSPVDSDPKDFSLPVSAPV